MTNYILARVAAIIPTMLLLLLFVVVLIRLLPGDAVDILLAEQAGGDSTSRDQLEADLGLNKSLPAAYVAYAGDALTGDLGNSLWSRESVVAIIVGKVGITLELGILALLIGSSIGITIGVISAVFQNTPLDYLLRSFSIVGLSVPNFAIATSVVVLPTIWWNWSPPLTYTPVSEGYLQHISQFIAPALILGVGLSAVLMRMTRTTMLDQLRQDYSRTARAKGLRNRTVILAHCLRNALIPVVSLLGIQVGFVLSGSVILESVFGLPGIGRELTSSLTNRDYPVIQGVTIVAGLFVILTNLVVDISYGMIDPRIRVR